MRSLLSILLLISVTGGFPASAIGQQLEITSLHSNGLLSWSDDGNGTNAFIVEFASALDGPWSRTWHGRDAVIMSNSVSVPMFYRVLKGFGIESMYGVWMSVERQAPTNNHFFVVQEGGLITETSLLDRGEPAGFCTVDPQADPSTNITITLLNSQHSPTVHQAGYSRVFQVKGNSLMWWRLTEADLDLTKGRWHGTLTEDPSLAEPGSRPIEFNVRSGGWIEHASGFAGLATGRAVAQSRSIIPVDPTRVSCAAVLHTGEDGAYRTIHISGTFGGDSIEAYYWTTSPEVWGTVSLIRN